MCENKTYKHTGIQKKNIKFLSDLSSGCLDIVDCILDLFEREFLKCSSTTTTTTTT